MSDKNKIKTVIVYLDGMKKSVVEFEGALEPQAINCESIAILQFKKGRRTVLTIPAPSLISATTVACNAVAVSRKVELKRVV